MHPSARIFATLFIWGGVSGMGLAAMASAQYIGGGPMVFIVLLLVIGAAASTDAVWKGARYVSDSEEKHKRRDKLDKVIAKLSDQEVEDLRTRLLDADGEIQSIDALLGKQEHR